MRGAATSPRELPAEEIHSEIRLIYGYFEGMVADEAHTDKSLVIVDLSFKVVARKTTLRAGARSFRTSEKDPAYRHLQGECKHTLCLES